MPMPELRRLAWERVCGSSRHRCLVARLDASVRSARWGPVRFGSVRSGPEFGSRDKCDFRRFKVPSPSRVSVIGFGAFKESECVRVFPCATVSERAPENQRS